MDLQEVLTRVAELSHEELRVVRKRAEEKTPARDHGHDFDEMRLPRTSLTTMRTCCAACMTTSSASTGAMRVEATVSH